MDAVRGPARAVAALLAAVLLALSVPGTAAAVYAAVPSAVAAQPGGGAEEEPPQHSPGGDRPGAAPSRRTPADPDPAGTACDAAAQGPQALVVRPEPAAAALLLTAVVPRGPDLAQLQVLRC
ncbi:hypothetical protein [Peterkaempfera griseoplana]|uniref:hypothetical protein n=1 Tax=Peterkaempfera griseoplana TaxID=66896 RepID=UPI0006E15B39|nr:hypothetical protein [Peterkaempfera griseoplana]